MQTMKQLPKRPKKDKEQQLCNILGMSGREIHQEIDMTKK